tara:strand:+ start:559 stop:2760 length:2202 start_codon:yes stop_codon:yes gene_type:complete
MQKIVLYIKDGDDVYRRVDMFDDETITLTSKIQDVRDIGKVFTDFSETFTVPASRENNKIFQHWYKHEIDNGFDARTRKDAIMEMDFSPFKRGKISLENVKLRDNKPFSYTVIFYGNLINLKDLLGDDELRHLPQLDDYTHDYSSSNVKTGLQSGLSSGKIVYPLISHTKRFYYDSATSSPQYSGNLYYNTTANNIGLAFDDLKPAIKCLTIIEAIEDKYDIQFTRDFFNNTEFSNLYLWLSRNKGPVGGDENQEEILSRICGDWGFSSGDLGFAVDGDTWSFTVENLNASFEATLTVTTSGGNTSIPFKMKAIDYVSGTTLKESTMAAGSSRTLTFEVAQSFNPVNYQVKWIIESNTAISFTPQIELTKFIITNGTISGQDDAVYNINGTGNSISTVSEIIITQNVPKLKVIDFLTGIFKMFNLTAYYVEDVGDADFDKIKVDTLDEFYADRVNNPSEGEWDITKFVDTSRLQVNRAFEYNEIDFSYQEPSTLLSINHQEQFNDIFGDEEVRPQNIDRGTPYEVTLPFEHMKFERLFDENETSSSPYDLADTAYLTDILWGYSAAGEFTSDTDVTPNTGNYEPVLTKPLVFYAIQETGLTSAKGIKWISDGTPISLTQYYRPSNTNEDGTSSTAPSFTINFDDEIDEWNLQNYGGTTNSLFKKFYATYINGIFNEKKRIYKLKAYLSTDILANYRLNDELVIQNKVYRINSIETNFNTEVSSLELLNKLSDD